MNLTLLLDMAVDGFGDRVVIGKRGSGLSPFQLRERALAGAARLRASAADSFVYLGAHGLAFPVALFAAAIAGVPLVPLNYRLGAAQLSAVLANHVGGLGVAGTQAEADTLRAAGIETVLIADWLTLPSTSVDADENVRTAVVIYTSGSTAAPKGVVLRHDNLVSYVLGSVEFASAAETDAALISVPPYHIAAVANTITNLYAGRRTVVLPQFDPAEWITTVRTEAITNALVVPTMLKRILDEAIAQHDTSLPSLRTLAYGGAPMPRPVIEQALRTWPELDFVNAYGLTETSSTLAVLGPEDHRRAASSDDPAVQARLGSAGLVIDQIELRIRNELGELAPAGTPGRIWVRGPQVSAEYLGSGAAVDAEGFFDTRDEGYLDSDGYLFIGGRADDTIIRGGENIAPAEIEEVLLRHPAVADAVVVGTPSEEWGQSLVAVAVLESGTKVDEQSLRDHVRAALRTSKTPDQIHFWTELPRTETGKLLRREVVARISNSML